MKLMKRNDLYFPSIWEDVFDRDWINARNVAKTGVSVPAVNIKETKDGFNIEMAVPGMKKEDFKVDLDHDLLTISAEEKTENTEKVAEGKYTRREFNYRSFKRVFTLPEMADADKIHASYEEGVLAINIPKKEEAKPKPVKMIEIA
ncbi:MAG: Hsp20/alpha crystallin family protein [Saprospiraceae bacterium]|nr:Hsp20/alpha crystallin family protein [Saprospiraceae bacterium]